MNRKQLVVVEDDNDIRELMGLIFEDDQYALRLFPTARMFNQYIKEHTPDVILLDVRLPDGNGIEICRELKSNPKTASIPVLLMSANAGIKPGDGGANAIINKPFNIVEIRRKVMQHL